MRSFFTWWKLSRMSKPRRISQHMAYWGSLEKDDLKFLLKHPFRWILIIFYACKTSRSIMQIFHSEGKETRQVSREIYDYMCQLDGINHHMSREKNCFTFKDPYTGLLNNPHIIGYYFIPYIPNKQPGAHIFHCSHVVHCGQLAFLPSKQRRLAREFPPDRTCWNWCR